jgi:hypothetical protein
MINAVPVESLKQSLALGCRGLLDGPLATLDGSEAEGFRDLRGESATRMVLVHGTRGHEVSWTCRVTDQHTRSRVHALLEGQVIIICGS